MKKIILIMISVIHLYSQDYTSFNDFLNKCHESRFYEKELILKAKDHLTNYNYKEVLYYSEAVYYACKRSEDFCRNELYLKDLNNELSKINDTKLLEYYDLNLNKNCEIYLEYKEILKNLTKDK